MSDDKLCCQATDIKKLLHHQLLTHISHREAVEQAHMGPVRDQIEVKKSLDLQCADWGCDHIVKTKKKGRTKTPVQDLTDTVYQRKEMLKSIETLQTICKASNQNLFSIVELWFKRKDGRRSFCCSGKNDSIRLCHQRT